LEIRQKERIKGKFASKVSPAVMNDILSNEDNVLEGKEREITVFFSDVRNFTNISEAIGDPKKLIRFMNTYMDPMTEIIIKTEGTVDKFIGDAIMAYWNAPTDVLNHADKAVTASLEQLHALRELNKTLREDPEFISVVAMSDAKGVPIVDIGIGLNSGVAIVGEMGSSGRSDYTVIGDPINLGSRLESLCKYYNSKLNISNFTKELLMGNYIYRFLDLVTVKGKSEPIEIWQIHDYDDERDTYLFDVSKEQLIHELSLYHEAIKLYKKAEFAKALEIFKEIESWSNKTNNAIYKIYIERCEHYIEIPPQNFNGVFIHTSKG
jgi:adenylate cyclase